MSDVIQDLEPANQPDHSSVASPVYRDDHPMIELWRNFRANRGALLGLFIIIGFIIVAIFAPLIAPYDPSFIHGGALRIPPIWVDGGQFRFLLGTDDLGRDLLSRLIYGARVSMSIGLFVVVMSSTLGVTLGLLAGYNGGWIESVIMRVVDILMSLPSILLAIVIVAVLGPNLTNAVLAVSLVEVPKFVRLVRASVLGEKKKQYVLASQSFGARGFRQAVINILPNCLSPVVVQSALVFSEGILSAAALGFLGLGAQPPTPEWGTMLADAKSFIVGSPWLVTLPGLCILIVVLAFNLFGDGLRDIMDPRMRR